LSVRVYPGGRVEVVAPTGASPIIVQRFIGEHRQWIDDRVQAFAGLVVPDTQLPTSIDLLAIERRYSIEYVERTCRVRVQVEGERLSIIGPTADRHAIAGALRQWLNELAMIELGERLSVVAKQTQLTYSRLQVRRQRTRWGSCSVSGTISLNVCLLFLDPAVVRYLLVHELCHTKQMNHSVRFWSLVAVHQPDYRSLDRALLGGWQQVPWWMFG
jgi:predicted metal-dependent hydrolase